MNFTKDLYRQLKHEIRDEAVDNIIRICTDNPMQADILNFEYKGKRLVHFAAKFGSVDLLQILLDIGTGVEIQNVCIATNDKAQLTILHIACENGHAEFVTYILQKIRDKPFLKAFSKGDGKYKRNAFYFAAVSRNTEVVKILQTIGRLNINEILPGGSTALFPLLEENNCAATQILCECGADVNLGYFERRLKAIHYVSERTNYDEMIEILLKFGANVNEPWLSNRTFFKKVRKYQEPLFKAVKSGCDSNAKVLLKNGANVLSKGQSSSHLDFIGSFTLAVMRCLSSSLISSFLDHGADPNEVYDGQSILSFAIEKRAAAATIEALVKAGADINKGKDGMTAIQRCRTYEELKAFMKAGISIRDIESQHKVSTLNMLLTGYTMMDPYISKEVSELLSSGADPNIFPEKKYSPLIVATMNGQPDVVEMLINAGADINHIDYKEQTAMTKVLDSIIDCSSRYDRYARFYYMKYGVPSCDILKILLNANAVIPKSINLSQVLIATAKCCDFEAMKHLINHGADIHTTDNAGRCILHLCWTSELYGGKEFVHFFVRMGGSLELLDQTGDSVIMALLKSGQYTNREHEPDEMIATIVLVFLHHGASCVPDKNGNSVLHLASIKGYVKTTEMLLELGVDVNAQNDDGDTALHACLKYCGQAKKLGNYLNIGKEYQICIKQSW